ncbi:mitochondrial ribosomal small subunit component [Yamadazyma tenuis]|uniref:37S ribosomal protein S25, mitochondrial n=1 Tax=Candida tenuis (strain ATCC 10573 / BCRC 21748 / CBS 615 / JCM 9827 / NBRC 10315 / NRRL Y-1498 / VKM Y-70) TaxID=590646 RepID=G3B436_CANTC|nr:37S ribosomal protein S25, mitochondrial [Yamadazyma tenuis ATCC 10573]EGV63765.1 37S ribosomal protein S25, mitochondrial [Yamadazyma tenuis ATCC 10573]WEJ96621.1 mitochondrial ribosomal small subunit component [Yamadazyma tenuis]
MKIQSQAATVLERTSAYLKSGLLKNKPVWFDVVANHPPDRDLTRVPKTLLNSSYQDPMNRVKGNKTRLSDQELRTKNNKAHRIPKLKFVEDELRNLFYKRHPWEFSRPKVLIENEGNDNTQCDWSHMVQFNKPLDGESVVQRTMWLLKNSNRDLFESYDQARFEFYRLRMEEEMQSAVSREESGMFGAVFPTTNLQHGVQQEQVFVDDWAVLAAEKTTARRATAISKTAESKDATKSIFEEGEERSV